MAHTYRVSSVSISDEDSDVRGQAQTKHATLMEDKRPLKLMALQYSSWFKLSKGVAWLLGFLKFRKSKRCVQEDAVGPSH